MIERNGGSVASGPSRATILLAADPSGGSSKLVAARKLGIKIMTPTIFKRKYGL